MKKLKEFIRKHWRELLITFGWSLSLLLINNLIATAIIGFVAGALIALFLNPKEEGQKYDGV